MNNENNENNNSLNVEDTATEKADTGTDTEAGEVEITLDDTDSEVDVEKLQATNKKLYARAKEAEAKLKAMTPKVTPPKKEVISKDAEYLTREEAILIAKGYEDEELSKLKAISKGNGCSLLDATKDEMFVLWSEKKAEETKKAKSQLGASKGSGSKRPEKSVSEMTREEHQEFVRKTFGLN